MSEGSPTFSGLLYKIGDLVAKRFQVTHAYYTNSSHSLFEVEDRQLSHEVFQLKIFNPKTFADQRQRELALAQFSRLRLLSHPNLQNIYEVSFSERGELYLVLEKVVGESLRDKLKQALIDSPTRPFSINQTTAILYQAALALNYLHSNDCLFLNLSPEKVFFNEGGELKLDLSSINGILEENSYNPYVSPEMLASEAVDGTADIYSLSVIAYQLMVGRLPYKATAEKDLYQEQRANSFPAFASLEKGVPEWFEKIILKAGSFEPSQRFASIRAFATELAKHSSLIKDQMLFSEFTIFPKEDLDARSTTQKFELFAKPEIWQVGTSLDLAETAKQSAVETAKRAKQKGFLSEFIQLFFVAFFFVLGVFTLAVFRPEIGDKILFAVDIYRLAPEVIIIQSESKIEQANIENSEILSSVEPSQAEVVIEATSEKTPVPLAEPTLEPTPVVPPRQTVVPVPEPSLEPTRVPVAVFTPAVVYKPEPSISLAPPPFSYSGSLISITEDQERSVNDLEFSYRLENNDRVVGSARISSFGEFRLSGQVVARGSKFFLKNDETLITLVGGQEVDGFIRGFYVIPSEGKKGSWEVRKR